MSLLMLSTRRWLELLICQCQEFAGRMTDSCPGVLFSELRELTSGVPDLLSLPEQFLMRSLLSQALSRIVRVAHLDINPDVTGAFLAWEASTPTGESWRPEWSRLLKCCLAAMSEAGDGDRSSSVDARSHRVLGIIQARYTDPELSLSAVAKDANLSPWHLARTLKRQTGQGFVTHLRRARVAAAQRLLAKTALSVKEIAPQVGYAHPNRLDQHFMRVCGITPSAFRNRCVRAELTASRTIAQEKMLKRNE